MSDSRQFIQRLEALGPGERSRLRALTGRPLDETLVGFDLFTGLWWPLRQRSAGAPRREVSWLVARLHASFWCQPEGTAPAPAPLPLLLGRLERLATERSAALHRQRFETLISTPLPALEPPLRGALGAVTAAATAGRCRHVDWVVLLDDLSLWDRGQAHARRRDIREGWAEQYLQAIR